MKALIGRVWSWLECEESRYVKKGQHIGQRENRESRQLNVDCYHEKSLQAVSV